MKFVKESMKASKQMTFEKRAEQKTKEFEGVYSSLRADPSLPLIIRLDGRSFSNYTKAFNRPFDEDFHYCMAETAKALMKETNASICYTQSDEITLICMPTKVGNYQHYFAGKIQKICSVLASICSVNFNNYVQQRKPEVTETAVFDCRVFTVSSIEDVTDCLFWRMKDCERTSVTMLSRAYFSHKELLRKATKTCKKMLDAEGVNWDDLPVWAKRGSFFYSEVLHDSFDLDLSTLPAKHQARTNPDLKIKRRTVASLEANITERLNKAREVLAPYES